LPLAIRGSSVRARGPLTLRKAGEEAMHKAMLMVAALISITVTGAFSAERPTRFWNLTHNTISEFQLAPAGTAKWGENQCKNDKDGTVDFDERLRITGIESGRYDARIKDMSGRVCFARNINIRAGEVFSVEERDLVDCSR
jgi:hypothetical protein